MTYLANRDPRIAHAIREIQSTYGVNVSVDYWLITAMDVGYLNKTGSNVVDVRLQRRLYGKVWRTQASVAAQTGQFKSLEFDPFLIMPAQSDVRLIAVASANNQEVTGGITGYLAIAI